MFQGLSQVDPNIYLHILQYTARWPKGDLRENQYVLQQSIQNRVQGVANIQRIINYLNGHQFWDRNVAVISMILKNCEWLFKNKI